MILDDHGDQDQLGVGARAVTSVATAEEPRVLRWSAWIVSVGAVVAAVCVAVALFGFNSTTTKVTTTDNAGVVTEVTTDEAATRRLWLGAAAGVGAVAAGVLAWGRLELSRREHRLARAADQRAIDAQLLAVRAQQTVETGQIADRYTRAVEQLGSADISVRLGALYALERLAHDSEADRKTIFEVICAWIRHHSVRRDDHGLPIREQDDPEQPMIRADGTAMDYRAALTIALRPPHDWVLPRRDLSLAVLADMDLTAGYLGNVDFHTADLRRVKLAGLHTTSFEHAKLASVTVHGPLRGVDFTRASLTDVIFHAPLDAVEFWHGQLTRVRFQTDATLTGSRFMHSRLKDVAFRRPLDGVDFVESTLAEVRFTGSTLRGVEFERVSGHGIDLRRVVADRLTLVDGTTLEGVLLNGATFTNSRFEDSELGEVSLEAGAFDGVVLSGVRLDGVDPGAGFTKHADGRWYSRDEPGPDDVWDVPT